MAYQLVVDGKAYDVPDDATFLTDRDSRVVTATWLRTFFWNTLEGEPFGKPEFQTTVLGNGKPHILCTVPATYKERTAYGVGEAWSPNLTNEIMQSYPALQARRRAESDAILAVLNIADRVYTDDQIPRSEAKREPNGLQPKPPAPESTSAPAESQGSAPASPAPETPDPGTSNASTGRTRTRSSKPAAAPAENASPSPAPTEEPASSPEAPASDTPSPSDAGDPRDVVIIVGTTRSQFCDKTLGQLLTSKNQQALNYIHYLANNFSAKTDDEKHLVAAAKSLMPEVEKLLVPASGQGRSA